MIPEPKIERGGGRIPSPRSKIKPDQYIPIRIMDPFLQIPDSESGIKSLSNESHSTDLVSIQYCNYALVIDTDVQLFESLQAIAKNRNIQVRLATTLEHAKILFKICRPDIIVLDLLCSDEQEKNERLDWLAQLSHLENPIPVVVSSAQTGFEHRLQVSRIGAHGFLPKPILPDKILDMLTNVMQRSHFSGATILIVSDDTGLLEHLQRLLMCRRLCPALVKNPNLFWSTLEQKTPDLLILDVDDTRISGLELCRVVRQDPRWHDLPIILLSERTDRMMLQNVFATGADDYVQKPVFESDFITRVLNRLERSRLLHELAETDELTYLVNRRKATTDINRLISIAERQDKFLCFVIFDIDHFKQINDQHGHAAGDQTLRNTGIELKQTFRHADVMARWGGDEFVLGLFDSSAEQCAKRLHQLMQRLHRQTINCPTTSLIEVTYSVGIAEYPTDGYTIDALYQAADQALYQAKANGRNQMCLAQDMAYEAIFT